MPEIYQDMNEQTKWENSILKRFEDERRASIHVSDLLVCMRRPVLLEQYYPDWDVTTLFRFMFGRALEKAVFSLLIPDTVQELEVEYRGLKGHIDFASDPEDYECKFTWSAFSTTDALFRDKWYWVEQAGLYVLMRGRQSCKFIVMNVLPTPQVRCFRVTWSRSELVELETRMIERMEYLMAKRSAGQLPMKTVHTWACKGCPVKTICQRL